LGACSVDDILALLLAFSASEEELEVLLVSLTFGNVDVEKYSNINSPT
jgi:inosine-uridine nucleoside N-ribohydrolase